MRSIQVTIQLQKQDDITSNNNNKTKQIRVSLHIKHSMTDNSTENNNVDNRKYIMCSLLLQLGKILGIQPSYAPSPYISTIFTEIYNKWSLKCIESNTQYTRSIKQLADITDGNELILCCGGYYKESAASMSNNCEQNLIDLIPSKCKVVTVSQVKSTDDMLPSATNASAQSNNKDDSISDIEDVTELYASKHKANQEVIDIDSGSDDEDKCFWEYDEYGNMKKTEAKSLFEYKSDEDDVISISSGDSSSVEDVTAIMLEKRAAQAQTMRDNAEEINDDDSDQDEKQHTVGEKRKRQHRSPSATKRRKRKKATESPIEVILEDKDIPICPGTKVTQDDNEGEDSSTNAKDKEQVDQSIKQRIIKLLNTGFHNNSNENEAKNAMKLARRLMERYNLDQAVLLLERGDGSLNDCSTINDDDGLQGGIVTTKIQNRKNGKPLSSLSRWQDFLVGCTCMNFHVEAFKSVSRGTPSRKGECSVTFYGIRVNAQLAAYAFKIASERISLMAAIYEPSTTVSILTSASQKAKETRSSRLSYSLGIVNGLEQDVKEGQRKEEESRKEKLGRAQQRAKSGEAHQESEDESSGVAQQQGELAKDEASSNDLNKLERENTAHLALIDHHKKIATDVLKVCRIDYCASYVCFPSLTLRTMLC